MPVPFVDEALFMVTELGKEFIGAHSWGSKERRGIHDAVLRGNRTHDPPSGANNHPLFSYNRVALPYQVKGRQAC